MRAARSYGAVDRQTSVSVADPVGLVKLVYDRLSQALVAAGVAIESGNIEARAKAINRAIDLIDLGLVNALDFKQGGELSKRLNAHYTSWMIRLTQANAKNSAELLMAVENEVRTIKSAWDELGR